MLCLCVFPVCLVALRPDSDCWSYREKDISSTDAYYLLDIGFFSRRHETHETETGCSVPYLRAPAIFYLSRLCWKHSAVLPNVPPEYCCCRAVAWVAVANSPDGTQPT